MQPTLLALVSIVIWSTLALANSGVGALSPFLSVGVIGIFGYHALLFAAFSLASGILSL